jgi:hypothetical protein
LPATDRNPNSPLPALSLSPMEKYRLVQEHKAPEVSDMFHEESTTGTGAGSSATAAGDAGLPVVRITQQGKPRNYISYAMGLFVS